MNQLIKTLAEDTTIATGAFAQSTVVPIDNERMPRGQHKVLIEWVDAEGNAVR